MFVKRNCDMFVFAACVILVCLKTGVNAEENNLECYQCRVERNEDCTKEYLKPCPTDQAYDVCMVSVINNDGHVYIEKKCALGPCNLRDPKQTDGLGLDKCDRSQNTYSCFECCKGNGCNTGSSTNLKPSTTLILGFAMISALSFGLLKASMWS